ncbi:MAG: twin-arginine translocase TatA/TatE family subunit [Promethearchaeota archaeon]|jgi:TatA/E family protein of Tat protein translocase
MVGPGYPELILILFIVLLLFGGKKLPELARSMGTAVQEFTKASKQPVSSGEKKENEEKEAILNAAKKLGIDIEGKDINEIAKEIVKATEKKESNK